MSTKILITGGPGTGKTSLIKELLNRGFFCFPEIVRELKSSKRSYGVKNYFESSPVDFTEKLFDLRTNQYKKEIKSDTIFYDRGPIDSIAYLKFKKINCPSRLINLAKTIKYDFYFNAEPWEKIYVNDEIREETFNQCEMIHQSILSTYKQFNAELISLPFESVNDRVEFILNRIKI